MLIISCGRDRAPRVNSPLRVRRCSSRSCELIIRRRGSWDVETFFYCARWFTRGRNLAIWWRCSFFIFLFIHLFVFLQDCPLCGPTQIYARSHISALSFKSGEWSAGRNRTVYAKNKPRHFLLLSWFGFLFSILLEPLLHVPRFDAAYMNSGAFLK